MTTITEQVAAGAALMDDRDPGWWCADVERAIDLWTLDLATTDNCVLGQRCPLDALAEAVGAENPDMLRDCDRDEAYGVNATLLRDGVPGTWVPSLDGWARAHGFTGGDRELDALTAEWHRVILERRETAAGND
jgi:hypothetical protein